MSDYKEILTSDRVYKKYKSIIPDTNVSIDDIIQKLSYFYKISKNFREIGKNQPISCSYIIEGQNNTETEVSTMANISPYSFIVVLPQTIIEIPQSSNLSWLTLFYALPKELVEKRAEYLELPRNIHQVLQSEKYTAMIQTDSFLELVWDCYAWSAWQFFQIPFFQQQGI